MDKIVFTGGGTAGHIMPNLAIIEQLKGRFDIHYIGSRLGMEKKLITDSGINYHEIDVVKLKRGFYPSNLLIPLKLIKSVNQAKRILKDINPKLVFSKGGFVSLPVALATKAPLISHESDFSLGLANKLTAKKAKFICCSFDSTAKSLKNGVYTGLPIRQSLFKPKLIQPNSKPTLLIMGGSLGSKPINDCITACIDQLLNRYRVIHITGKGKQITQLNNKSGYTQMQFCPSIAEIYAKTDVCISRAGATALFELTQLKIPSLIIPLKKASRGDQIQNAQQFLSLGLIHTLSQDSLSPQTLLNAIDNCFSCQTLKNNLNSNKNINATQKICQLIVNLATKTAK